MGLSNNQELMRAIIMQHYDQPLNKVNDINQLNGYINYHNKSSSCIDDINFFIKIKDNQIVDAKFYGLGCAISTASTDIICEMIKNHDISFIDILLNEYFKMIRNEKYDEGILGELVAFCNIYQQSNRIACASIGANALKNLKEEINDKK